MLIDEALRIRKRKRFLEVSEYWPRAEMESYQLRKLKRTVRLAYDAIPYYNKTFKAAGLRPDDIKSVADLRRLPLLGKQDVQVNLASLHRIENDEKVTLEATGGSTGEPLKFYANREMHDWKMAAAYRAWSWCGYDVGDKLAELWGHNFEVTQSQRLGGKMRALFLRRMTLNTFNMSDERMAVIAKQLQDFKPKVIRAYSASAYLFAKYVRENDVKGIEPQSILTTAEKLHAAHRAVIESVFGCKVHDGYGSRETSLVAHQCENVGGYHISEENSIVEFVKDGEPVSPGESGEIVVTDLHNTAMPWIRYRSGDLGTALADECACGRKLVMLGAIEGRIHDIIKTPDGRRVPGEFFPHLFKDVKGLKEYRITQRARERIVVELVKTNRFTPEDLEYLRKHMVEFLGDKIEIEFAYPDSIDWPASGKRRFTISEVD